MTSSTSTSSTHQAQHGFLSIDPSHLKIEQTTDSQSTAGPNLSLALLQPLAQSRMLEACRNPASKVLHVSPSGQASGTIIPETLNLTALGKAWRHTVGQLLPVSAIVFDLSLPEPRESLGKGPGPNAETVGEGARPENEFQRIYWTVSAPNRDEIITIDLRDVMRVAVTIATTARMRVRSGEHIQFDVVFNEEDKPSIRGIKALTKQLEALSQWRTPQTSDSSQAGHLKDDENF